MADGALERRDYLMIPEKEQHRVVQVVKLDERYVVLREPETGVDHTVRRAPIEERLRDGRVVEVTPRWEPAGQTIEV